jgi:hypothetical protein
MTRIARLLAAATLALSVSAGGADLFNNTNTGGVLNGASNGPIYLTPQTVHVTQLVTYHWNNGQGAKPGTISLKSLSGPTYGPFQAKGVSGQGNAPNVNWVADVDLTIPIGSYQVIDSDPATWSQNSQSHGIGFAIIRGEVGAGAPPPPTVPPPTTGGKIPPPSAPPPKAPPAQPPAPPAGPTIDLFNNTNVGAVSNHPTHDTVFLAGSSVRVRELVTYHWNNGKGAKPGTIAIHSLGGQNYGPFPAKGTPGSNNVANANWVADVDITLPLGTYQIVDSDPATWAHNVESRGIGFAIVRGERLLPGGRTLPPPGAPPPGGTPPGTGFKACMTNAGAVAALGLCAGAPGSKIPFELTRALKSPISKVTFKPFQVTGIPGGTAAQVISAVNGSGVAAGSIYEVDAPKQLCLGGGGSWDLFLYDASGAAQGDIGRFTVDCRAGVPPTTGAPPPTTAPPPPKPPSAPFKPCFVNAGSIGASSPCTAHPGDLMTIQLSRTIKSPLAKVVFKPYSVTGIPGGTGAQVIATLSGSGLTAGSTYTTPLPPQICLGGNGSWDLWPIDASNTGQGDIGRVNVICH